MEIAIGLLSVALALATPVVVIAAVVTAIARARRDDEEPADPGIGTVRRVFLYGLAFVSLAIGAAGVALLIGGIVDAAIGDLVIADNDADLAIALSLTVVGLPAWLVFVALAQRSLARHPIEARSMARWTYLGLVRAAALSVAVGFGIEAMRALLGVEDFDGGEWGWLLTALAVWAGHQAFATQHPAPSEATRFLDRLYLAFAGVLGLYILGAGLVTVLTEPAMSAYDALFRSTLLQSRNWGEVLRYGFAEVAVGGAVWAWHWLGRLKRDSHTPVWHVVVFLFGILPGLAVAVTSGAVMLNTVLEWAFGAAESDLSSHFAELVREGAFLLVGLASWVYHRAVLDERAPAHERRTDPERVYRYLVAAAGLLAMAGGLASAVALAVDAVAPVDDLFRESGWWERQLAATVTLIVVGAPLWARYWFAQQRITEAEGAPEREALPRRAFLFLVFGVAVIVMLVNLAVLLYEIFDSVLAADASAATFRDIRWSLGMLLAAGAVSAYYWFVLRDDQAASPEATEGVPPARTGVRDALVVAPPEPALRLAQLLNERGISVRRWQRTDIASAPLADGAAEALLDRLDALDAASVLLVVSADGSVEVVPVVRGE